MSKYFYTHVAQHRGAMLLRGFKDGNRIQLKKYYEPYLFTPVRDPKKATHKSIKGLPLQKVQFSKLSEARDYVKRYEDVDGMDIYGLTNYLYTFMNDEFGHDNFEYDASMIRVGYLDIEVKVDDTTGFPNVLNPMQEVTAITVYVDGIFWVWGCGEYTPTDKNIVYLKFENEQELLTSFIKRWREFDLDVLSGWNVAGFDIPYMYNRLNKLLGADAANSLSPWGIVEARTFEQFGRVQTNYEMVGITVLDYLDLYKKFSYTPQASYRLDHIANYELKVGKLDYSEYESLFGLYKHNFQKFIEYNVIDVLRVKQLDDKLKFIEMVYAIAYDARVNYLDTFTSVKMWDIIIHNYLLKQDICVDPHRHQERDRQIAGGHVKDPQVGMHRWTVSFDLNSLYPHLIMQYNIGPDTLVGLMKDLTVESILNSGIPADTMKDCVENNIAIAASGFGFNRDKQSFLRILMETMYNDRARYKKEMLKWKQVVESLKGKEDTLEYKQAVNNVAKFKNFQLVKKVQLNSVYGAMGNPGFRWYDPRLAESITLSGQLSIRWVEKKFNEYFNKLLGTKDHDYIIAIDTDSIYLSMDKFVQKYAKPEWDDFKTADWLDRVCSEKLEKLVDKYYDELASMMNAMDQRMKMKRECIANKGIWTGKKHYILNVFNNEGVRYDEPELKIMGIEVVRSSTPPSCRENIKKALNIIMNEGEQATLKFIDEFREKFKTLPFEEVAFPRSVSEVSKWSDGKGGYILKTPVHVKSSMVYNRMLKEKGVEGRYRRIEEGNKIRFVYLKMPNPSKDTCIASPDSTLPEVLGMDKYIDYNLQFEKAFVAPMSSILEAIGWKTDNRATLESFFS